MTQPPRAAPVLVESGRHFLTASGRSILPVGAHVVPREGPDWPWRVGAAAFDNAFAQLADLGMNTVRIDLIWQAVEPAEGDYDEEHLRVLDEVLEAARRHGLWLHPALLVGGEVGDAFWDVPYRQGRNPHADPHLRTLSTEHVRMLAQRWRGDPAIIGWDLTDEPPYWVCEGTTDTDATNWTKALSNALRSADPEHLVTVGTASQDVDAGPFRADVIANMLDFVCVHPYPIYSPDLYPDSLLDVRMTLAAAFETALARGAGKPVMVHEFGASSTQFDPEAIAAYDRLFIWSSFGRGSIGFLAWCWSDAELPAYRRVPYSRQAHETQFGIVDHTGAVRPRGHVLAEFAKTVRSLDLDRYASFGPKPSAALLVPHDYVAPFDPASFGLDGPSGLYASTEESMRDEHGFDPLTKGWLNSFVLAARANLAVEFVRESPHDRAPETRLLMLPAPLSATTTALCHVRTGFWGVLPDFVARGGTAYISLSADSAIPDMDAVAGCRIIDRAAATLHRTLRFIEPWGTLRPGDSLELPDATATLGLRGARLRVSDSRIIAVDDDGHPALVVAQRGSGFVVTCSEPIELLLASVADAHRRYPDWWRVYGGLADLAEAREEVWVEHPDVVSGVLRGPVGGLATLTNHGLDDVDALLHLPDGVSAVLANASGQQPLVDRRVHLRATEGMIVMWTKSEHIEDGT